MEGQSAALRDWASTWPLFMKTLLAGGCAGAVAKTSTAPLERAKIMLQTRQARSVADALGSMWRAEGVRGLFRGNSAAVARVTPYAALHLMSYEYYRRALVMHCGLERSPGTDLVAGAASGATAVAFTYPLDLARTRIAWSAAATDKTGGGGGGGGGSARRGLLSTLRQVASTEGGLVGLYRGITPTLAGILPYAGFKFFVYESAVLRYRLTHRQEAHTPVPTHIKLLAGASAGLVAQTITYPLDVVRRNMQVEAGAGLQHVGVSAWVARIVAADGWRGLYRGLSVNYIKVVPTTAVGFTVYEELKAYLRVTPPAQSARRRTAATEGQMRPKELGVMPGPSSPAGR